MKPESSTSYSRTTQCATIEPGIKRHRGIFEYRVCATEVEPIKFERYLNNLAQKLSFENLHTVSCLQHENNDQQASSLTMFYVTNRETLQLNYWKMPRLVTLIVQSSNPIDEMLITQVTRAILGCIESTTLTINQENMKTENQKVEVRDIPELGRGVYANQDIAKGEFIGGLYGAFHEAQNCMSLPDDVRDHVMQCAKHYWRGNEHAENAPQYLNHSCNPNCGVSGLFDFVAMKDIKAGEQITTDYAMQDDSNWTVPGGKCLCGSQNCRGDILPYRDLSDEEKKVYHNFTSHWIRHKYGVCTCPKD